MQFRTLIESIRNSGQRVLVVGLGISGVETAAFLNRLDIPVVAVEKLAEPQYKKSTKFWARVEELRRRGIEVHFGIEGESVGGLLANVALCVLSPGVSLESAITAVIRRAQIPMVSELELGIEILGWPSVVVTGSNGKTTTVNIIAAMLEAGGKNVRLCGNVGTPVVADLDLKSLSADKSGGVLVVEASSYQLETCTVLKPKVGVLLNLSDNHLERHGNIERYRAIKARLFERQDQSDVAILNADNQLLKGLELKLKAQYQPFFHRLPGSSDSFSFGARIEYAPESGVDSITVASGGNLEKFSIAKTKLLGLHNRENLAAAILAAKAIGISSSAIQNVIDTFEPLEHRLELVGEGAGRRWINDSKSTTVASSLAALKAIAAKYPADSLTIMLGGMAKAGSWDPLMQELKKLGPKIAQIICFGGDAKLLASNCRRFGLSHLELPTMAQAVNAAAQTGNASLVLFTPGCASFDEFSDFEHRGTVFKSLVRGIQPIGSPKQAA